MARQMFVLQVWECEFDLWNSCLKKKPRLGASHFEILVFGRQRQEEPWGLLVRKPSLMNSKLLGDLVSKRKRKKK